MKGLFHAAWKVEQFIRQRKIYWCLVKWGAEQQ